MLQIHMSMRYHQAASRRMHLTLSRFACWPKNQSQVNGLVHISQMADEFVANCDDHVKEGDMVRINPTSA